MTAPPITHVRGHHIGVLVTAGKLLASIRGDVCYGETRALTEGVA